MTTTGTSNPFSSTSPVVDARSLASGPNSSRLRATGGFSSFSSCSCLLVTGAALPWPALAFAARLASFSFSFNISSLILTRAAVVTVRTCLSCASVGVLKPALLPISPTEARSMRLLSELIQLKTGK